ncbi:glycosyltransferase [Priestia megaterium]|nr:glycosyltransferase [Priestia megaterium]
MNKICINLKYAHYSLVSILKSCHEAEIPFFNHITNVYIPMLVSLQKQKMSGTTIIFSPLLLKLLSSEQISNRYMDYLRQLNDANSQLARRMLKQWDGSVLNGIKHYYHEGVIECLPMTTTNSIISTLITDKGRYAQVDYAIEIFANCFERSPSGFYFQRGEYTRQIDKLLKKHQIQYSFIQTTSSRVQLSPSGIFLVPYPQDGELIEHGESICTYTHLLNEDSRGMLYFSRMSTSTINETSITIHEYITQLKEAHQLKEMPAVPIHLTHAIDKSNEWFYAVTQQVEAKMNLFDFSSCLSAESSSVARMIYDEWLIVTSSDWLYEASYLVQQQFSNHIQLFNTLCNKAVNYVQKKRLKQYSLPFIDEHNVKHLSTNPKQESKFDKMSILMLTWEFPPLVVGGLSRHVFDLSRALAKAGHHVVVITTFVDGLPVYECMYDVHVYRVKSLQPHHADFLEWVNSLNMAMAFEALKLAHSVSFHIIHAHEWLVGAAAQCVAEQIDKPLITTIHATEHGRNNGIHNKMQQTIHHREKDLIEQSSSIIVCSEYMKKELIALFNVSSESISVFPNGIDQRMVVDAAKHSTVRILKRKFNLRDAPIIFSIGRVVYEKGFHLLIEAAVYFKQRNIDIQFIIAGKGPLLHAYRRQINEKNIEEYIQFIGYITDDERNQFLQLSQIVVFPSLYEPFGIVALEGMIAKKPTVVSDVGGLKDIVRHEVTGFVFQSGNVRALVECMVNILKDEQAAKTVSERGYVEATTLFSWDQIASDTSCLFKNKIEEKNKRRKENR